MAASRGWSVPVNADYEIPVNDNVDAGFPALRAA